MAHLEATRGGVFLRLGPFVAFLDRALDLVLPSV